MYKQHPSKQNSSNLYLIILFFICRRVRNASGAGSTSTETPSESNEENSNSAPIQVASCPVTPAVQTEAAATPPSFLLRKTKRVSL